MSPLRHQIEPSTACLRILIADDNAVIRKQVRRILERHPGFRVCGEAHDGVEAIKEALRLRPDVVVLNISMPFLNGMDAARQIKAELPQTAIVMLSTNADKHFVEEAKNIGAGAYVVKTEAAKALVTAIETATVDGEFVFIE